MREQQVVRRRQRMRVAGQPRRVLALAMAEPGRCGGLVLRDPDRHRRRQGVVDDAGVVDEAIDRLAGQPAANVLQRLRQLPVVEREHRHDAARQQAVDEPAVVVEAGGVRLAAARGLDARPLHGEHVGLQAEPGDQVEIALQLRGVVGVAGTVAGVAVQDAPRLVREGVPDRRALAIGARGALDLVAGRGGAPDEAGREVGMHAPIMAVTDGAVRRRASARVLGALRLW